MPQGSLQAPGKGERLPEVGEFSCLGLFAYCGSFELPLEIAVPMGELCVRLHCGSITLLLLLGALEFTFMWTSLGVHHLRTLLKDHGWS